MKQVNIHSWLIRFVGLSIAALAPFATPSHADYYSPYYGSYSNYYNRPSNPIVSLNLDSQTRLSTSFRIAAREDRISDMDVLLKKGADIDSQSDQGTTALMYAARNCSVPVVTYLLEKRAMPNALDNHDRTALIYAVRDGCESVVRLLLSVKDIDLATRDYRGMAAIDYAGSSPILTELFELRENLHFRRKIAHSGELRVTSKQR